MEIMMRLELTDANKPSFLSHLEFFSEIKNSDRRHSLSTSQDSVSILGDMQRVAVRGTPHIHLLCQNAVEAAVLGTHTCFLPSHRHHSFLDLIIYFELQATNSYYRKAYF